MPSFKALVHKWEIPAAEGDGSVKRQLATKDLLPVPAEKRQWTKWSYSAFWLADSFNVNTFAIASSGVAAGLSWWQALIATALGYGIAAPFLIANGRPGAVFHIKFPVVARASFGIYGAYWVILNRVVMSCVWWGVQAWIGGECVAVMLQAIFPSYARIPDTMSGSGTTTKAWLGFFIFWLLALPTIWPPIEKARHFFNIKAIVAPIAGITFLVWSLVRAHGAGPVIHQAPKLSGFQAVWPMVTAIMSAIANMATLVVNNPDITSYADKPSSMMWSQLITLPLSFTVTGLVGILIASCSEAIYGQVIWDPIQNLSAILDGNPSHGERFGVWFIAFSFIYVQLIMNLSANSIGAGCDMTALLPRWINIRRGSYICAIAGLAYCPWHLFASSNDFTTYLSAYSVLLSSVAGVMLCDYYFVRKGNYRVSDLYTTSRTGWYYYTYGVNWRAYAAYLAGIAPNMAGFVGAIGVDVPEAATRIYAFSWFTGVAVSMAVYYLANLLSPQQGSFPTAFCEVDLTDYEVCGLAAATTISPVDSVGEQGFKEEEASMEKKYADGTSVDVIELRA